MAVKYQCPKCGRRFTEWGAEKTGFKCPHDEWCPKEATGEIELIRVGSAEDKSAKRLSLKRLARRPAPVARVVEDEEEVGVVEADEVEEEDEFEEEDAVLVPADDEEVAAFARNPAETLLEEADDADELDIGAEELSFDEPAPGLGEEPLDAGEDVEDWRD
ncbi:MAG TPA: hypothetical protein PLO62_03545 [Candidatus Hydrogenedentes bacterium]|nr:hypothetical protein [Candidatus Hydrogenedentota bacterium]HOS03962.1 hypothetical protein [Candidatus Hydrogenedentota bacterium]